MSGLRRSAILELAPANHFYAEGRQLKSIRLICRFPKSNPGDFAVDCSYLELEGRSEPHGPPVRTAAIRSGPIRPAARNMLRMRQVISTSSEQESRSYDESDDREPQLYQKNMFVVKEDTDISEAYFIDREEVPFGFEFFRKITLREVNFGEKMAGGPRTDHRRAARLWIDLSSCAGACGKVRRRAARSSTPFTAVIGGRKRRRRSLRVLPLPGIHIGGHPHAASGGKFDVERNIHSFVAALDFGLRRTFRGDPGHLLTTMMDEPVPGSDVRKRYLVLYDGVPGGTGYLKELMRDQQNLLEVFEKAYEVLKHCTCQSDAEKDGCYRCLLAYRGRHDQLNTSRQAAIRTVEADPRQPGEVLEADRAAGCLIRINRLLESELEGRFIEALRRTGRKAIRRGSVTHHVVNGKEGFYLRTPGGSYLVEPQVPLGPEDGVSVPSIADFVIRPERPGDGELPIAVFTDGFEYHADPQSGNMRVGIDTAQRMAIARSGRFHVWSLTWDDVESQFREQPDNMDQPTPGHAGKLDRALGVMDPANRTAWSRVCEKGSFEWLVFRLDAGRSLNWGQHGRLWLAAMLDGQDCDGPALDAARGALLDPQNAEWAESASIPQGTGWKCGVLRVGSPLLAAGLVRADAQRLRQMEGLSAALRLFDEAAGIRPCGLEADVAGMAAAIQYPAIRQRRRVRCHQWTAGGPL